MHPLKKPCVHVSETWKEKKEKKDKHYVDLLKMHQWEDQIKRQTTIVGWCVVMKGLNL